MPSASTAPWLGSPRRGTPGGTSGDSPAISCSGVFRRICRSAAEKAGGLVNNKRNTSEAVLRRSTALAPQPDNRGGNDGRGQATFRVSLVAASQQRTPCRFLFFPA